ncbi:MAG: hypothetical protein AB7P02_15790 [Alphaproteobacteria bacterium]
MTTTIHDLRLKDVVLAHWREKGRDQSYICRGKDLLEEIVRTQQAKRLDIATVPVTCAEEAEALRLVLAETAPAGRA